MADPRLSTLSLVLSFINAWLRNCTMTWSPQVGCRGRSVFLQTSAAAGEAPDVWWADATEGDGAAPGRRVSSSVGRLTALLMTGD